MLLLLLSSDATLLINIVPSPISGPRQSFLDYGGKNSIGQFSLSFQRAQGLRASSGSIHKYQTINNYELYGVSPFSAVSRQHLEESHARNSMDNRINNNMITGHNESTPLVSDSSTNNNNSTDSSFLTALSRPPFSPPPPPFNPSDPQYEIAKSTLAQTTFNSINTLMGIGMLSLPFGISLTGWIPGSILLFICAFSTSKTAKILGKIMKHHPELGSFADIVSLYGSPWFLLTISGLFCLDLTGASLGMILLFSDLFNALLPHVDKQLLKCIVIAIVFVLSFFPLSILAFSSLIGVFCTFGTIALIIMCGVSIKQAPGSLFSPAMTRLWPENISNLFMALGIFMSPWGGHPVFPEFYLDMRHPAKFNHSVDASFSITLVMDYCIACVGFLMYGIACQDSILKNIMSNKNYPAWTAPLFCVLLGLLPLSKLPLVTRPMITLFELVLLSSERESDTYKLTPKRVAIRIVFFAGLLAISLVFSSFGRVISFLGSAICFTICLALPLLFYKHFFGHELSATRNFFVTVCLVISVAGAVLGTYGSIILKT